VTEIQQNLEETERGCFRRQFGGKKDDQQQDQQPQSPQ
jgi:hypothetical protein